MRFARRRLYELNHYLWPILKLKYEMCTHEWKREPLKFNPFSNVYSIVFFFKWPKKISATYIHILQLSAFLSHTLSFPHSALVVCNVCVLHETTKENNNSVSIKWLQSINKSLINANARLRERNTVDNFVTIVASLCSHYI